MWAELEALCVADGRTFRTAILTSISRGLAPRFEYPFLRYFSDRGGDFACPPKQFREISWASLRGNDFRGPI